jgi:hypothetical protein
VEVIEVGGTRDPFKCKLITIYLAFFIDRYYLRSYKKRFAKFLIPTSTSIADYSDITTSIFFMDQFSSD